MAIKFVYAFKINLCSNKFSRPTTRVSVQHAQSGPLVFPFTIPLCPLADLEREGSDFPVNGDRCCKKMRNVHMENLSGLSLEPTCAVL